MIRYTGSNEYKTDIEILLDKSSESEVYSRCRWSAGNLMICLTHPTTGRQLIPYLADVIIAVDMLQQSFEIANSDLEKEVKRKMREKKERK